MALIKCPECGNNISEHAPSCPHCGIPKKPNDPFFRDPARKLTVKEKLVLFSILSALLVFYAWVTG